MKARITSNPNHWLGKEIAKLYDTSFYSRESGWDINFDGSIKSFLDETEDYDITINFCPGYGFRAGKLLVDLYQYCNTKKIKHTVLNIGSYLGLAVLHNPDGTADLEKQLLNLTSKKITFDKAFFSSYLDSRIINISHIDGNGELEQYPHLNGITVEDIIAHIKIMMESPYIKLINVQSRQPGMHRINEGKGPIMRGSY